jgi:hypothetical protein
LGSARHIPRLLSRTHLRAYLGDLEWAEIGDLFGAGRFPSPVWGRKSSDAKARWDIREVDRYIDRAADGEGTLEDYERKLDQALGCERAPR